MDAQSLNSKTPKKLSLSELKGHAACYVGKPVPEKVTWSMDGEDYEIDVFVRRFSYSTAIGEMESIRESQSITAQRIATSIVDELGQPVFSVGDITGESHPERGPMSQTMVMALLHAIYRANGLGKSQKPTTSTETPKSGANSSSTALAEKPLRKRSKT